MNEQPLVLVTMLLQGRFNYDALDKVVFQEETSVSNTTQEFLIGSVEHTFVMCAQCLQP